MKNLNINWRNIVFAATAIFAFLFTAQIEVSAQAKIQFNLLYECPRYPHNFKVLSSPNEKTYRILFVNLYTPSSSFEDELAKTSVLEAIQQGGCKLDGKPIEAVKDNAPRENEPKNNQPTAPENTQTQTGRFKVGDRVLASPASMKGDEWFEKCTVIKDMLAAEGYDSYRVVCDDPKSGIGKESYVKVPFIKAWANAEPPPAAPECEFNEPAGTVSKTSKPTAETFKRVIYDRLAATSDGRKIGTTFETFQLGKSYVNRLTSGGLMNDGAPQGAMIYPVKTRFILCERYDTRTIRKVYDAQYNCFKDAFGEWICPNSALKMSDPIYLPNK